MDLSQRAASNGSKLYSLGLYLNANNFLSIDPKDINLLNLPLFDATCQDESNKLFCNHWIMTYQNVKFDY